MIGERILGPEERPNAAVQRAWREMRLHQQRVAAFGADLFADPVWGLLLELFIHRSAGIDAEIDMIHTRTTSRYIALMETRGMIRRGEHNLVTLTDQAFATMKALLAT